MSSSVTQLSASRAIESLSRGYGNAGRSLVRPYNAAAYSNSSTETGYLKITLPVSWTNTMIWFTLDLYMYQEGMTTLRIGGYNYISTSSWSLNPHAHIVSTSPHSNISSFKIEYGHDGSTCAIYISHNAEAGASTWTYPQVVVRDVNLGFSSSADTWGDNAWDIEFTATLGTITATKTVTNDNPILGGGSGLANKAAFWSDTETITYSNAVSMDGNGIAINNTLNSSEPLRVYNNGTATGTNSVLIPQRIGSTTHGAMPLLRFTAENDGGSLQYADIGLDPNDQWLGFKYGTSSGSLLGEADAVLKIYNNNYVGIGTGASASYLLDIAGNFRATGNGYIDGTLIIDSNLDNAIQLKASDSSWKYIALYDVSTRKYYLGLDSSADKFVFGSDVAGSQTYYFASGTSVGVGTSTPSYDLHVSGTFGSDAIWTDSSAITYWGNSGTAYGRLTWNTGIAYVYAVGSNALALGAANTETIRINNANNVGVGTSTPAYKLDVSGTLRTTGLASFDSGLRISGVSNELFELNSGSGNLFDNRLNLWPTGGAQLVPNSEFYSDLTGFSTYDNNGSGAVTRSLVADAAAPNSSGNVMRITYTTGVGTPSPSYGGFYVLSFTQGAHYQKGDTIFWRIIANIPSGRTINITSNAYGTENYANWVTDRGGIGDWKEYLYIQKAGQTGTFGSMGYVYISGGADSTFSWDVARVEAITPLRTEGIFRDDNRLFWRTHEQRFLFSNNISGGTSGYVPYFDSADTFDITNIYYSGSVVGIGTATPSELLHVYNSTNADTGIRIQNASTGASARTRLYFVSDAATAGLFLTSAGYTGVSGWADSFIINSDSSTSGGIKLNASLGGIKLSASGSASNDIYINTSGNVGIGEGSPSSILHITSSDPILTIEDSNAVSYATTNVRFNFNNYYATVGYIEQSGETLRLASTGGSSAIQLFTNGGDRVMVTSAGDVGIGTSSPAYELDVVGDIRARTNLYVGTGGGYFYNDTSSRVRIDQDFYTNNSNTYIYGDNTFLGNASGDVIYTRDNVFSTRYIQANSANGLQFRDDSGTEYMRMLDGGGVNIYSGALTIDTTGRALLITGNGTVDGQDVSIYLGNAPSAYGFDITYVGTGTGNTNALRITSTNAGSPKDVFESNQDGIVDLPQLGATVNSNIIWHAGNDGSGSGLDADTLDGVEGASYLRSDVSDTYSGSALSILNALYLSVSSGDIATQRVDARDDATNYARAHWYGLTDAGATSNFRHAWYDGSNYINVTASSGEVEFTGVLSSTRIVLDPYWSSSVLASNSISVNNATDGFAFGVGTDVSTWFSWDSTAGVKRAIDVYNDGSKIILGQSGALVGVNTAVPTNPLHITGTGTIGSSSLNDAWVLIGSTTSGLGMDTNEIYCNNNNFSIGTLSSHQLSFATNSTTRFAIESGGTVRPNTNGAQDLGSTSYRWQSIYGAFLSANAGSAASPSIRFTDDSNTGFYSHGTGSGFSATVDGTQTARFYSGGLGVTAPAFSIFGSQHLLSAGGARKSSGASGDTGYLKISFPVNWPNTMISFWVDVFDYSYYRTVSFYLAGYPYSSGSTWYNTSEQVISSINNTVDYYKIEYAHDGSTPCVYISKEANGASTTWGYLAAWVRDVSLNHSNTSYTTWATGWSVTLDVGTGKDTKITRNVYPNDARISTGDFTIGTGSAQSRLLIQKADNDVSDHIIFYNGTTRVGEIGVEDSTWLRINQETANNIYTPRYIRADQGFFVGGTSNGINSSGNFVGGTIAGASDYSTLLRSNAADTASGKIDFDGGVSVWADAEGEFYIRRNQGSTTGDDITSFYQDDAGLIIVIDNENDADTGKFAVYYKSTGNTELIYADPSVFRYKGSTIWHGGNDGSGSGLDADTLDGVQGASYLRSDVDDTFAADLTITGGGGTIAGATFTNGWLQIGSGSQGWAFDSNEFYAAGTCVIGTIGAGTISWLTRPAFNGGTSGVDSPFTVDSTYVVSNLNADLLDDLHSSSFLRADDGNAVNVRIDPANGLGLRFWDSDSYKIWMSAAGDATWGGRLDATSDYNMYFRMDGGTNRGFVFQNGTTEIFQIESTGQIRTASNNIYANGNLVWHAGNDGAGSTLDADLLDGIDSTAFINNTAQSESAASNIAVGWYTIATNTGDRAIARFGVRDTSGGRHQSIIFHASHKYGNADELYLSHNSVYSTRVFTQIRIKSGTTYDGAALQIYISDATNNVTVYMLGDNFQISGWVLKDWIPDATDPGDLTSYGSMTQTALINFSGLNSGDISLTGDVYVGTNSAQYKVLNVSNVATASGYIAKGLGNNTVANSIIYESSSQIGINDTTPSYTLDVNGTGRFTGYLYTDSRLYVDNTTNYLSYITGEYGSIQINGSGGNGWEGFSIDGRIVFMHDGSTQYGLYNDVNNQWGFYGITNGKTDMRYAGSVKLETTTTGVTVTGNITQTGDLFYMGGYEIVGIDAGDNVFVHGKNFNNYITTDGIHLNYYSNGSASNANIAFYADTNTNVTTRRGRVRTDGRWVIGAGNGDTSQLLLVEGTTRTGALGIDGAAGTNTSKLYIVGNGLANSNPAISMASETIDTSTSSSGKTFYGWLHITINGTKRYIQLYT